MYLQSFHLPLNGATSEAAYGAFSPWHQESGAVVISRHHRKTISLKTTLGRCWLTLLLLVPCPNLLPCLPWLHWMWGTVFLPYPCVSLVNSGEAAAASSTSWKLDGSWKLWCPTSISCQQPGRDGGLTPQAEITSRPKPPLPEQREHVRGPRSPQGAYLCSMPWFSCH